MTLLNTPMPAEKALKIIRSTLESNSNIKIEVKDNYEFRQWATIDNLMLLDEDRYVQPFWEVTIVSITQIIPTYSVWDKVLILSTGEIGEIEEILDERLQNENNLKTYGIKLQSDKFLYWVHRSQIAKLPNDL